MAIHQNVIFLFAFILSAVILLATYRHHSILLPISSRQQQPKPRFIFVDLGANRGDTLEVFLGEENAKFQYEFPRPDWATYDQAGK